MKERILKKLSALKDKLFGEETEKGEQIKTWLIGIAVFVGVIGLVWGISAVGNMQKRDEPTEPTCVHEWEGNCVAKVCDKCGTTQVDYSAQHSWRGANCTEPKTCAACGATEGKALGHSWNKANCMEHSICATCGAKSDDVLAHNYEMTVLDATCTEHGRILSICTRCQHGEVISITEPLGHTYSEVTTAPTCTEKGYKTFTCTACGESYVGDYVDALGHTLTDSVSGVCVTCGKTPVYRLKHQDISIYVGDTYTLLLVEADSDYIVPASELTFSTSVEGFFTVDENGKITAVKSNLHYKTQYVFVEHQGVTYACVVRVMSVACAAGHTWDDGVVVKEATENEDGQILYTCTVCGETETKIIPALEHEHQYDAVVTEPTCTKKGYTTHTCRCGDSYKDSEKTAIGHDYAGVVTEPTYDERGYTTYTCTRCGDSYVGDYTDPITSQYQAGTLVIRKDGTACLYGDNDVVIKTYTDEWNYEIPVGVMYMFSLPWDSDKDQIRHVIIEDGLDILRDRWFADFSNLETVKLGNGLSRIGGEAFLNCVKLKNITIPLSVTTIHASAFEGCNNLTTVMIEDNSQLVNIYGRVFSGCDKLKSVSFGNNSRLTSITNELFKNCADLEVVEFGNNSQLQEIGDYVFYGCSSLKNITIPNTVNRIGGFAFAHCINLTSIVIPDNVTIIDGNAFNSCKSLINVYFGNNGQLNTIAISAFVFCTSLTDFTIPGSVSSIGDGAFSYCTNLVNVTFEGDVPDIGDDAFYHVSATACYPAGNETWTTEVMLDYGGTLVWVSYEDNNGSVEPSEPTEPIVELELNRRDFTLTGYGASWNLYSGPLDPKEIIWTSSNENVATVTDGLVVAVGNGQATITAEYNGQVATCIVRCRDVGSFALSTYSLIIEVGESFTVQVYDTNGVPIDPSEVRFYVEEEGIITVDDNGIVTGLVQSYGGIDLFVEYKGEVIRCHVRVL